MVCFDYGFFYWCGGNADFGVVIRRKLVNFGWVRMGFGLWFLPRSVCLGWAEIVCFILFVILVV